MNFSPIPNFGDFGVYIDDLDLENVNDSDWLQLRKELCSKYLLMIFRNTNLSKVNYSKRIGQWGDSSFGLKNVFRKYGLDRSNLVDIKANLTDLSSLGISDEDGELIRYVFSNVVSQYSSTNAVVTKLSGTKNQDSKFLEGDLEWHQDESSDITFCGYISLLGSENMTASSTGFVTTASWYQKQSDSFRSEIDDLILIHEFDDTKFNKSMDKMERMVIESSVGIDCNIPLVVNSPGGIKGLHFPINSAKKIKGMPQSESDSLFSYINKTLFVESNIYDHWYQNNNDLLIFDNTITMHRRTGSTKNRVAYRIPFDIDTTVLRFNQKEFSDLYLDIKSKFKHSRAT